MQGAYNIRKLLLHRDDMPILLLPLDVVALLLLILLLLQRDETQLKGVDGFILLGQAHPQEAPVLLLHHFTVALSNLLHDLGTRFRLRPCLSVTLLVLMLTGLLPLLLLLQCRLAGLQHVDGIALRG
jgi:hypothetical protein